MEMRSKEKYRGGKVRQPKPCEMNVSGMKIYPPTSKGPHPYFTPGGMYSDKRKEK